MAEMASDRFALEAALEIGPYRLDEELYAGADTVVLRGKRVTDGKPITMKLCASEYPNARKIAALRHEYAVMRGLDLACVVTPLDLVRHGNALALVLEAPPGRPLSDVLSEKRVGLASALYLAEALAGALAEVHARGVVHRDVKPHNILCSDDFRQVWLFDFGISTRADEAKGGAARQRRALEGTLRYIAPEQTGRMSRLVDHRADLYSLGVTLYEVLTGGPPFTSDDPITLVHDHLARTPVPPSKVDPAIPEAVSEIVLTLLAKDADDRYQSADGLREDLARCREQWEARGTIPPFPQTRADKLTAIRLPEKLVGREAESRALKDAFDRARRGGRELVLLEGPPGSGKSRLAAELEREVARRGGYFLKGRDDAQSGLATPHAALAQALGELAEHLDAERSVVRAELREAMTQAALANGRVLVELAPKMAEHLGHPPPLAPLEPAAAERRLLFTVVALIRAVATEARPLVMLLDDIRASDAAATKLVEAILSAEDVGHVLVLLAHRDGAAEKPKAMSVTEIVVGPLPRDDIRSFVALAVGAERERAAELADLLGEATNGNVFLLGQALVALEDEGIIRFDRALGRLDWELDRVRPRLAEGGASELTARRLARLPKEARALVEIAACAGGEIELDLLAAAWNVNQEFSGDVGALLAPAIREHLLVEVEIETEAERGSLSYSFWHERYREAVDAAIPAPRRAEIHLALGRLLRSGAEAKGEKTLECTRHFELAAPLVTEPEERLVVCRMCLAAGRQARGSGAFRGAADHFRMGASVLPEPSSSSISPAERHALSFELLSGQAECEFLAGGHALAESLYDALLEETVDLEERVDLWTARISLRLAAGHIDQALLAGLRGLSLFGIELPTAPEAIAAALEVEMAEVARRIEARGLAELADAPEIVFHRASALQRLLTAMHPPAFMKNPALAGLLLARLTRFSLEGGHSDLSPFAYCGYGMMLAIARKYPESREFGRLAISLEERLGRADRAAKTYVNAGAFLHFTCPREQTLEFFRRGREAALASFDFPYVGYASSQLVRTRLSLGHDLEDVLREAGEIIPLVTRVGGEFAAAQLKILRQEIMCLLGRTRGPMDLGDDTFDPAAHLQAAEKRGLKMVTFSWYLEALKLRVLYGDVAGALESAREAEARSGAVAGLFHATELAFHGGLALARAARADPLVEGRSELESRLSRYLNDLETWTQTAPSTYENKWQLVLAERHHARGEHEKAFAAYDRSIAAAQGAGLVHEEALANELAARAYLAIGAMKSFRLHMTDAFYGYLRWGASAKAQSLVVAFPELAAVTHRKDGKTTGSQSHRSQSHRSYSHRSQMSAGGASKGTLVARTGHAGKGQLELVMVMRAAQAIASEIVIDEVLARMMRILAETTGAQRGVWLVEQDGALVPEAALSLESGEPVTGAAARAPKNAELPRSILDEVAATGNVVLLDDATRAPELALDAYTLEVRPRSILCFSVTHQGRRAGILYLEHRALPGAFSPDRVDLCVMLAAQAATALENARLYARVSAVTDELRGANDRLEAEVLRRTGELEVSNERLMFELGERARAEEERAALQAQVICAQEELLHELSTPFLPISEGVMVMPIIGKVDEARATQIHETALHAAAGSRAHTVIFDITGVKTMDGRIASSLVRAAKALELLGVKPIITGIRADVAHALVQHGEHLEGLLTRSTLRAGIALAMNRRERVLRP